MNSTLPNLGIHSPVAVCRKVVDATPDLTGDFTRNAPAWSDTTASEAKAGTLRILVHPGTGNYRNAGDTAVLTVCLQRLRRQWPDAQLDVLTDEVARLIDRFPWVHPINASSRMLLFGERNLLGSLHRRLPRRLSRVLSAIKQSLVRRAPWLVVLAFRWKDALRKTASAEGLQDLVMAFKRADLHVLTGMAGFNDNNRRWASAMLRMVEFSAHRGTPVLLFSQGIGPLEDPVLVAKCRQVLPRAALIGLREGRYGEAFIRSLGVENARAPVTGDDAVELAVAECPAEPGPGIGINLRVARSTGVDESLIEVLRPVIQGFAREVGASLVPVPISVHPQGTNDTKPIRALLADWPGGGDAGESLDTPLKVIRQVGRCRILVTGAYHAAVFALSQGIPSVCLWRTPYSLLKFEGLRDLFGPGCMPLNLDQPDLAGRLRTAMQTVWNEASQLRPKLREAAARQVETGRRVYDRALAGIPAGARRRPAVLPARGSK